MGRTSTINHTLCKLHVFEVIEMLVQSVKPFCSVNEEVAFFISQQPPLNRFSGYCEEAACVRIRTLFVTPLQLTLSRCQVLGTLPF